MKLTLFASPTTASINAFRVFSAKQALFSDIGYSAWADHLLLDVCSAVTSQEIERGSGVRFIMFIPGLGLLLYQSPVICHPPYGIVPTLGVS